MNQLELGIGEKLKNNFIEAYECCYDSKSNEKICKNLDKVRLVKAAQELAYKSGLCGRDTNFGNTSFYHVNEYEVKRLYTMVTGNV